MDGNEESYNACLCRVLSTFFLDREIPDGGISAHESHMGASSNEKVKCSYHASFDSVMVCFIEGLILWHHASTYAAREHHVSTPSLIRDLYIGLGSDIPYPSSEPMR